MSRYPNTQKSHYESGLPALLSSYHSVIQPIVGQAFVALDPRVPQRGILVPTERENRLVHLLGIKYLQPDKQIEILTPSDP
jgi:hypothetical protein